MPRCDSGSNDSLPSAPLNELLQRLHENLEYARDSNGNSEVQFSVWQQRWTARREQIIRRLETIDLQLAALVSSRQPRPQLSVVGDCASDDYSPRVTP